MQFEHALHLFAETEISQHIIQTVLILVNHICKDLICNKRKQIEGTGKGTVRGGSVRAAKVKMKSGLSATF